MRTTTPRAPTGFDFCVVGGDRFRADVFHLHADVLQVSGEIRRRLSPPKSAGTGAREGFAGGNVKLSTVHCAGNELPVERTHIERRIHMAAATLDGQSISLSSCRQRSHVVEFDDSHSPGGNLIGEYRLGQTSYPRPTSFGGN